MPCSLSVTEYEEARQRLLPVIKNMKKTMLEKDIADANGLIYRTHKIQQATEVIRTANNLFAGKLALAFSGGKDSLVVLHLALSINGEIPVIFNNTTVEFPETIEYVRKLQKEWDLNLHATSCQEPFFKSVARSGWATHEERWCCKPYKDQPAFQFLSSSGIEAEFTGTTRTESIYRRSLTPFRLPKRDPMIIRVNPIYDWNEWEVWRYIRENQLPYNPLYDKGYKRIGCWCCPLNGPSHYVRLKRTHPKLHGFLSDFKPAHPGLQAF